MRARNPVLHAVVAVVVVAAAVAALVAILTGDLFEDEINAKLLGAAVVVALAYLAASPGLVLLDQGRERGLALATIGVSALALVLTVIAVFTSFDEDAGTYGKVAGTLLVVALVLGTASAIAHRRRAGDPSASTALGAAAVALAAVAGLLLVIATWSESDDTALVRAIAALAVAALAVAALSPIPRRLAARGSGRVDAEDPALDADRVHAPERVLTERDEPRDTQR